MPFGPKLVGERVLLRDATSSDVEARQRLGSHAEIQRMFGAEHPVSGAMTRVAAESWLAGLGGEGTIEWVVEADGSFLGTARLHSFDAASARYAVGFLDPTRLGKGHGTEVTTLVLEYAFGEIGLEQVSSHLWLIKRVTDSDGRDVSVEYVPELIHRLRVDL